MKRLVFGVLLAALALSLGVVSVAAQTATATQNVVFVVPASLTLASAGDVNLGNVQAGATATGTGTLNVGSNAANGFDISAVVANGSSFQSESNPPGGTGCVPVGGNSVQDSALTLTGSAVTGGTGAGGVGSVQPLGIAATSLFTTHPMAIGATMVEAVGYKLTLPAGQSPNSLHCAYVFPITYTLTGL